MRYVLFVAVLAATPATACNTDFLVIDDWSIIEQTSGPRIGATVEVQYRLAGNRAYRLIEGSIIFEDRLGFRIESIAVPREKPLTPGMMGLQTGLYPSSTLMMAARMNRDDVIVTTCTNAVVYADGAKETF